MGRERGGGGLVFHFTIRAAATAAPARAYQDEVQPALQGKRVLIVDDNATNRLILSRQVESWHMLAQATAIARRRRWSGCAEGRAFDVAILDMQMPEMDGLTLARSIRQLDGAASRLPLIMLTSLGTPRGQGGHAMTSPPS